MSATGSILTEGRSDARDMVIAQLRRELKDLADTQEQAAELRTKLDSLAHLHEMLAEEKRRAESEAHERHQKLAKTVAGLRAEVDTLSLKNSELEYHCQNLQKQNDLFEESLARSRNDYTLLENEYRLVNEKNVHLEERIRDLEKESRDKDTEKASYVSQKDRQDSYIEELLEALKERDRIIERSESEREALEEDLLTAKKELEKRAKDVENGKDLIRALGEKLEAAANDYSALELEISNTQKELEASKEESRQAKRRVETLRQENIEIEGELKRQIRLAEESQERGDELAAKAEEISKERLNLQTKLAGAKSESEMLRRENERLMISHKDVCLH